MTTPVASCQLRIWHPWAYNVSMAFAAAASGITAATRSYLVVAVYPSGATAPDTVDAYGIARYSVGQSSLVENKTNALNDNLLISWTAPLAGLIQPDHYNIYMQAGASWNWAATGVFIKTVAGDVTSAIMTSVASIGTALPVDQDVANTITLDPCMIDPPGERSLAARGINGIIRPQSYAHTAVYLPGALTTVCSPFESVVLPNLRIATTQTNWMTIRKWVNYAWPVLLINSNDGSYLAYDYWHGVLTHVGTAADTYHESNQDVPLMLMLMGIHLKA